MANIADIILKVEFPIIEFKEEINKEILTDLTKTSYEYFTIVYEDDNCVEISMGSSWTAPIDEFQKICNLYGCRIIGTAYEFGNDYVEAFELTSEENNYEEITKNPKKGFETINKLPINEEV